MIDLASSTPASGAIGTGLASGRRGAERASGDAALARAHRSDIDGLRAVAVLLVLAFHVLRGRPAGGFVGVDVFFVISGFLITTTLLRDLEDGRFSPVGFYERRVRRILPALCDQVPIGPPSARRITTVAERGREPPPGQVE